MTNYYGTKRLRAFKNIAEDLHNRADELEDHLITWKKLTTLLGIRLPMGEMETVKWTRYRPHWVVCINKQFIKQELPHSLDVVGRNRGVILSTGKRAVGEQLNRRTKKLINSHNNAISSIRDLTKRIPELKPMLDEYNSEVSSSQYSLFGRIAAHEQLSEIIDIKSLAKLLNKNNG